MDSPEPLPESDEPIEVLLRPMVAGDINLVSNSWLKNNRKSWASRGVRDDVYYAGHHKILERLIARSAVMVACDPAKPDRVYGWLCGEFVNNFLVLHYVWVRDTYKHRHDRRMPTRMRERGDTSGRPGLGLGTLMLERMLDGAPGGRARLRGLVTTHSTASGDAWLKALHEDARLEHYFVYNPYLLNT
jgi:hypothetical protein